jgi:hypothetical protein
MALLKRNDLVAVTVATVLGISMAACDGAGSGSESHAQAPRAGAAGASVSFDQSDLDAYARGIRKEVEAVRAAKERSTSAKTPQERGEAIQGSFETATIPVGAAAAGLPVDRYREIREAVHEVFETLDFQGKIDGPLSMDMSRASEQMKARLSRDAFAELPAESASALRGRMDQLVPIWIEYINLTAVAG